MPEQMRHIVASDGTTLEACPFVSGDDFLATFNIQQFLTIPVCMILLLCLTLVFTALAYCGLLMITSRVKAKSRAAFVHSKTGSSGRGISVGLAKEEIRAGSDGA